MSYVLSLRCQNFQADTTDAIYFSFKNLIEVFDFSGVTKLQLKIWFKLLISTCHISSRPMFHLLLQKALTFAQLYDETKDPSLLTNCESVPQYKDLLRTFQKFTLKDLLLEDLAIKESFIPGTIPAATVVEDSMISVGYFFIPAGM